MMSRFVRHEIEGARAIVASGWLPDSKGGIVFAQDAAGRVVGWNNPAATRYTLLGALLAGAEGISHDSLSAVAAVVKKRTGDVALDRWNDDPARTKDEVLALLDEALAS